MGKIKKLRIKMLSVKKFQINEKESLISDMFFDDNCKNKKYIMGISKDGFAEELSQLVNVDGFVDDFINQATYLDKPIMKTMDIDKESVIVICSTVRTRTAYTKLKQNGFLNIIHYPALYKYKNSTKNMNIKLIDQFEQDFIINQKKYELLYTILKDSISKMVFEKLINYRLTCNLDYMSDFKLDMKGQYFEDFLNLQNDEVFVDIGGYDGQTSVEFIKHCPLYKSIYLFEPFQENLILAKVNLSNFKNVHLIPKGLSDKKTTLKFDVNSFAKSASCISEHGSTEIEVDTLDSLVNEKVTFIKMDIEGAEALAIEGMKNHILNDYPKMAISVYHKVDDLWKIPEQVLAIRDDYDIYIRHYTEGTDETVMFFIPQKSSL
jgi:FkbM family methyltransferase